MLQSKNLTPEQRAQCTGPDGLDFALTAHALGWEKAPIVPPVPRPEIGPVVTLWLDNGKGFCDDQTTAIRLSPDGSILAGFTLSRDNQWEPHSWGTWT